MFPTAKEMRRRGRAALAGNWPVAVLAMVLMVVFGGQWFGGDRFSLALQFDLPLDCLQEGGFIYEWTQGMENPLLLFMPWAAFSAVAMAAALWQWITLLIGGALDLGGCLLFANMHRGRDFGLQTLTERFSIFLKALGLRLYMSLFIILWGLLLIVPGIIASYRYRMATWLMAENPELGIREAVEMSKYMMQGHKGRLFCLDLSFIGWMLLCALTFGIGNLLLNPYLQSTEAAFYLDLLSRRSPYEADCRGCDGLAGEKAYQNEYGRGEEHI